MPKTLVWIVTAVSVVLLAGCALKLATYTVSGYLKDALGRGIENATISVSYPQGYVKTTTDKNGYWSVSGIAGKAVVTPQASGWTFEPKTKVIEVNSDTYVNFTGQPYYYFVSGKVSDKYGEPIPAVTITFTGTNLTATSVKTDLQGFWKSGTLHGKVLVKAEKNGWLFHPSNGKFVTNLSTAVNFVGERGIGETRYIPITGIPGGLAVDEKDGKLFVTNSSTNMVYVYNVYGYNKIATFQAGPNPAAMCYDAKTDTLFIANSSTDTITVLNASDGKLLKSVFIGMGSSPTSIAVNEKTGTVYVTNSYYDAVNIINASTLELGGSVRVGKNPQGIAIDTNTNMVYVVNSQSNTVSVINGRDNSLSGEIEVGIDPVGVAVNELQNKIYVANKTSGTVSVIDGNTDTVLKTLQIGGNPSHIWIDQSRNIVYVTESSNDLVAVIDGSTNTVLQTVTVGKGPVWISGDEKTGSVYVSNTAEKTVSVLH